MENPWKSHENPTEIDETWFFYMVGLMLTIQHITQISGLRSGRRHMAAESRDSRDSRAVRMASWRPARFENGSNMEICYIQAANLL